jgi:hypothetical protein
MKEENNPEVREEEENRTITRLILRVSKDRLYLGAIHLETYATSLRCSRFKRPNL